MFDTKTVSLEWGAKTLTLETGRIASSGSKRVMDMWFRKGTEPQEVQAAKGEVKVEDINTGDL